MAMFREMVLSMSVMAAFVATVYFWNEAVTKLKAPTGHATSSSTTPTPSPSPAMTSCSPDKLQSSIDTWTRWMIIFMACLAYVLWYLRAAIELAAQVEARELSWEDEPFKILREKAREATDEAKSRLDEFNAEPTNSNLDRYVIAIGQMNIAVNKAAQDNIKQGMARLPRQARLRVRLFFCLAIILSSAAGVCAAVAYYISLRLKVGCIDEAVEIVPFTVIGMVFVIVHIYALWVCWFQD